MLYKLKFDCIETGYTHYCDTCLHNIHMTINASLFRYDVTPSTSFAQQAWFCNEVCMNIALLQNLSNIRRFNKHV
mgnify:FL=1